MDGKPVCLIDVNIDETEGHYHDVGRGGAVISHSLVGFGGVDKIAYTVVMLA